MATLQVLKLVRTPTLIVDVYKVIVTVNLLAKSAAADDISGFILLRKLLEMKVHKQGD